MKKVFNRFLTFGLSIAMLFGFITSNPLPQPTVTAEAATTADSYYDSITATSGTQLLGQLHDLITSTHKKYTSYDNCRDNAQKTDPGPDGKGVMEFYTHESITTYVGDKDAAGSWNREHVWPQSLSGGLWKTSGAGSDMHHIRPSEKSMNGTRGNDLYGNVTGGTAVWSKTSSGANSKIGGYSKSGVFMPSDVSKGDAARIVMYVYTHYNTYSNSSVFGSYATTNGNGSASFGNLPIRNVVSASSDKAAFDILLEWNKEDPVDDIERARNEAVYEIQGNRNPFIDNESYAEAIWGGGAVDPNPGGQGGQGGGTQTTESFKPLTQPQEGTYKLAMDVNGTYHYAKDALVNQYYIGTTTDISSAADYTLTQQGSGWVIKQGTRFLEMVISGTHANPEFHTSQTDGMTWTWDSDKGVFIWVDGVEKAFLGNYDNHYDIAGAFITYFDKDYHAYLGTYGTDTPTPPVTDTDQEKVNAALSSLQASRTIDKTTTLETKSGDVNLAWTKTSPATLPNGITFSGNTLTVTDDRPTTDTIITFNVTASLNGKSGTKPVTITVKGKSGTVTPPTPGDTKTITITLGSFTLTDGYGFKTWSAGGVEGIAYIYGGDVRYPDSPVTDMQFNNSKGTAYLTNISAVPGKITSIKVVASGQYSNDWSVLTSGSSFGQATGKPTGGTNHGKKSVSSAGETWSISGSDSYFAVTYDTDKYAGHLASIEVTYVADGSTVTPDPDTHMQALADALECFAPENYESWNFGVDVSDLYDGITLQYLYKYFGYNIEVTDKDDGTKVYWVITTDSAFYYEQDENGNYQKYGEESDEFKAAYLSSYIIYPDDLVAADFTFDGTKYVATDPEAVGDSVLGDYGNAEDDGDPWVSVYLYVSDGHVTKIEGTLESGEKMTFTFTYGNANFTLPEVGGTDPVDPTPALSGITVSPDTLELTVGGTKNTSDFTVTAQPAGATLPALTWTVTVEGIVKIENGVITALTAGQTAIKIKAGEFEATINVTVKASDTTAEDTAKVQAALNKLTDETIEASKTLATNDGDVQLTWTLKTEDLPEGIKFENNTISFTELPAEQTVLTFEVKATLNNVEQTKTITITIKAKPVTPPDPSVEANAKIAAAKKAIEDGTVTFQKEFTEPNTTGVDLPAAYEGTTLTWALQETSEYVKVENGKLIVTALPDADLTLTLVATISCEHGTSQTANVTITVKAKPVTPVDPDKENREAVQAALAKLNDETVNATKTLAASDGDVQFTWTLKTETLPKGITFADNTITITELPDAETVLTFEVKATLGNVTETKTVKVTVQAKIFVPDPDEADRETVTKALATLSDETVEKTTELKTSEGTVQFTWSTQTQLPEGITFSGHTLTVTDARPATDTAITFTVTAKLNNVELTKTVTVTVKAKPAPDPSIEANAKIAAAKKAIEDGTVTFQKEFTEANTTGVDLPTEYEGATLAWELQGTSEYVKVENGKLIVSALPDSDLTLTLVATISCEHGTSQTANVTITVKAKPVTPVDPDKEDRAAVEAVLGEQTDRSVDKSTRFKTKDGEVELTWTTETALPEGITFSGDTLTITTRPAEDFAIVFTVTAKLNNVTQSKQVTITVKAAVPDQAKVQAFHEAVAGIPTEGAPAARLTAIRNALNAYNALTDAEKLLAAEDYAALQAAVKSYNESVRSYNDAAKNAESGALSGIIG